MQGEEKKGIEQICQGLDTYRDSGADDLPYLLALLAELHRRVGDATAGIAAVNKALAIVDRHTASHYTAELHRLKGELLLALSLDHQREAEACFHRALGRVRR
ncbi:hypothetical protein C2W62_44620 [Candidatus Entotheonella serta]|nr:hypothetical protein C2W62_44620 [Candidatus Entotheonella serta]